MRQHDKHHPVVVMSVTRTYSVNSVATILDRSRAYVYAQMKSGELKFEMIRGARRVYETELQRFMAGGNECK
jgi:excisionase family DNA binding protein